MNPVKVADYRGLAQSLLRADVFDYIDGGACDEITKSNNRQALNEISIRPCCLRDVSSIDLSVTVFGSRLSFPLLIAPMAFHQLVDKEGEPDTSVAAKECGVNLIVSCMSNRSLEEIAGSAGSEHLWAQLYIFKDRALTQLLIHRIEQAGYKAIVLTVGVPVGGKRERDLRNQFSLSESLTTGNFKTEINKQPIYHFITEHLDPSLTWKDIEWLQSITRLPIILKGILNPVDAEEACQRNIAGIVVSNHGGRQLDTAESAITALPDIVRTAAGRTMVFVDGAIERGTDVFKALALGADAVLIGRPVLWAMAVGGKNELVNMLELLKDEFALAMKLTGCRTIQDIKNYTPFIGRPG
ncbi:FMN-dependent dehydrogenase [Legionella quinlivanii]|uniref:FMN-dependent dehydrogenase n=1 Tax=Legionella quinlivanii TaxID=45073 RepID=A0A0W0Y368_9GAMM|nr:alpha-hydroxy acid oxidase [Legionella quinlivanii]KTD51432.1 FMN-dependent dehydrogenase [Legionella quinlivanii]MCW8451586.1 alpha-hydroxy-acid oxidizing protein [Legionella quinlivanii]SEG10844.1 4-hydroxymandelate oxidase [Legionella quinlivanii DSM 21216]STY10192.1 FMN-dependent dehydrogenase [Legionella quinlivanii]